MNPARIIGPPPKTGEAIAVQPQSTAQAQTVVATLDTFLKNYFDEASKEDASRAGGLNGHLSVARLLDLEPPVADGVAAVLVSYGALYHRLHYFKEITDRYCDTIGLPKADMPVEALIDSITKERAPLLRARDLYGAALLVEPTSARAMLGLAGVRTLEGMPDAADRLYKEAANQDPSLEGHVALRRAAICEAAEKWSEAADLYLKAAEKLEVMGEWHENAARCLRRCGRFEESLRHYYLALDWFRRPGVEFFVARTSSGEARATAPAGVTS
jgi:tetratricopeptide (TPR) repeat protein